MAKRTKCVMTMVLAAALLCLFTLPAGSVWAEDGSGSSGTSVTQDASVPADSSTPGDSTSESGTDNGGSADTNADTAAPTEITVDGVLYKILDDGTAEAVDYTGESGIANN